VYVSQLSFLLLNRESENFDLEEDEEAVLLSLRGFLLSSLVEMVGASERSLIINSRDEAAGVTTGVG
jgi:hypothetical protein